MERKPQDLLEFLRRKESGSDVPRIEVREDLEPTTRFLLFRRSQVIVAGVAGGLLVLLAFLLGLAVGGDPEAADVAHHPAAGYVIRVASYKNNERGKRFANVVRAQLERKYRNREVTLQQIPSQDLIVVTVGSWVRLPSRYDDANKLLKEIHKTPDLRDGTKPFADAKFWRIER